MNKKSRELLAKSFEDIESWNAGNFTIWNNKLGIELWMANGLMFFNLHKNWVYKERSKIDINFSLIDKIVLYPKARHLVDKITENKLRKALTNES